MGFTESFCCVIPGRVLAPDGGATEALEQRCVAASLWYETVRRTHDGTTTTKVIVSGGDPARCGTTEASVMKSLLITLGMPPHDILEEHHATNTVENAYHTRALLTTITPIPKNVTVITSAFHLPRALYLFEAVFSATLPGPSPELPKFYGIPAASAAVRTPNGSGESVLDLEELLQREVKELTRFVSARHTAERPMHYVKLPASRGEEKRSPRRGRSRADGKPGGGVQGGGGGEEEEEEGEVVIVHHPVAPLSISRRRSALRQVQNMLEEVRLRGDWGEMRGLHQAKL